MNKGISNIVGIIIVAIILMGGIGGYMYLKNKQVKPIACTMEAKQCPDGSAVGRIGHNCEFAECPIVVFTSTSTVTPTSTMLTQQTLNKIVQKIKSAPNSIIKASTGNKEFQINYYYSVGPDPLDPGSKDALIFEMETSMYIDENGQKYPNGPINNLIQMRDTDFDTFPNDYWTNDFGNDLKFRPLTQNTPDVTDFLSIWVVGMTYFRDYLLQ